MPLVLTKVQPIIKNEGMFVRILYIYLFFVLASLLAGCGASSNSSAPDDTSQPITIDAEANKLVAEVMQQSGATAVTLAIAKDGRIQYEQAYGFKDLNGSLPLEKDALMRTASIIKPVTAAAVRKLAECGLLALSDHVFCDGNNTPCWLPAELLSITTDSRIGDITVEHLIAHQGGWYRDVSGDPLVEEVAIRDLLNLSGPPNREDIIRQVMQRPLDFAPGDPDFVHDNYSNFGYLLLGMIIEKAAQSDYIDYVHMAITDPLGIHPSDFKIGASKLIDHDVREPNYISSDICDSTFTIGQTALCAEEGADNKNWFASGGIISTAGAMALFAQSYRLPWDYSAGYSVTGEPLIASGYGLHGGALPGLSSMVRQLPSGESYAIFLNVSFNLEPFLPRLDRVSQLQP